VIPSQYCALIRFGFGFTYVAWLDAPTPYAAVRGARRRAEELSGELVDVVAFVLPEQVERAELDFN
jgi:hypothetical protein